MFKSNEMSLGERAFLYRRRNRLTTAEMAAKLGISGRAYFRLERDIRVPEDFKPDIVVVRPTDLEKMVIMRKRMGWTQRKIAGMLGCCRSSVTLMEIGRTNPEKLKRFWQNAGKQPRGN